MIGSPVEEETLLRSYLALDIRRRAAKRDRGGHDHQHGEQVAGEHEQAAAAARTHAGRSQRKSELR